MSIVIITPKDGVCVGVFVDKVYSLLSDPIMNILEINEDLYQYDDLDTLLVDFHSIYSGISFRMKYLFPPKTLTQMAFGGDVLSGLKELVASDKYTNLHFSNDYIITLDHDTKDDALEDFGFLASQLSDFADVKCPYDFEFVKMKVRFGLQID